jgi:hypothetical protein
LKSEKVKLLQAWILIHKEDLLADWELAKAGEPPKSTLSAFRPSENHFLSAVHPIYLSLSVYLFCFAPDNNIKQIADEKKCRFVGWNDLSPFGEPYSGSESG